MEEDFSALYLSDEVVSQKHSIKRIIIWLAEAIACIISNIYQSITLKYHHKIYKAMTL